MLAGSGEKQYKVRLAGGTRAFDGIALVVGIVTFLYPALENCTM
jgi:hypothetical protein